MAPVSSLSESGIEAVTDGPLSPGDPMQAHLPEGTKIYERPDGIDVRDPAKAKLLFYQKASCVPAPSNTDRTNGDGNDTFVQDVLIIGEVCIFMIPIRDASNIHLLGSFSVGPIRPTRSHSTL